MKNQLTVFNHRPIPQGRANARALNWADAHMPKDRPWFLDSGTLLGIFRDGDLIPHDTDVDVSILSLGGWQPPLDLLPDPLVRVTRWGDWDGEIHQLAYEVAGTVVDVSIFYYALLPDLWINYTDHGKLAVPAEILEPITNNMPHDPVAYLRHRYGPDWRIERTSKGPWEREAANLTPYNG